MTSSPTPSLTPSQTPTLSISTTPSITATVSSTTTPSPTPTPLPDLLAISRAASQESINFLSTVLGASLGGLTLLCIVSCIIYRVKQRRYLHEKRMRRLDVARTRMEDRTTVYGVSYVGETVSYTVQRSPQNLSAYRSKPSKMNPV